MTLTALTIRHWQFASIVFLLLMALGIGAFVAIPRASDPHIELPTVLVTVVLPGAAAADMEEAVAKPVERVVQGLDDIREVRSTNADGLSKIIVEFDYGTDPDEALDRVTREVGTIRPSLPQGVVRLDFERPRTADAALLQLALVDHGSSPRRIEKYARDLRDALAPTPGVRNIVVTGLQAPEVQVLLDWDKLAEADIQPLAVSQALTTAGAEVAAGAVHIADQRLNLAVAGPFRAIDDVRQVSLRSDAGRLLLVGDMADVRWGTSETLELARFNDRPAVFLAIRSKDSANALDLRRALVTRIAQFRRNLPPDITLEVGFDQSSEVRRKLGELSRDFLIALALVLLSLSPLGLRPSLVVIASIPTSLLMGVLCLWVLGYTINQISIAGFVIALGLLVDDSIVVTENIARNFRNGGTALHAAVEGTREITSAVMIATGVLLFAFLPMAFLPEASGEFVRGIPVAVIVTVASSLLISLTLIPFLAARLLEGVGAARENRLLLAVNRAIDRVYRPFLHMALDWPKVTFWGAMLGCAAMLATVPLIGFSLFPSADIPIFVVRVETPEGSGIAATDRAVRQVSAVVAGEAGVHIRMDSVGRGNPQLFYNSLPVEARTRYGEVLVVLDEWDSRQGPALIGRLRRKLDSYVDAKVTVVRFEQGPPIAAPIAIKVQGPELATLKALAQSIAGVMAATKGLRDVNNPMAIDRLDIDLGIDEAAAGLHGIPAGEAKRALRLAISGDRVANLRDEEGDGYPVVVRFPFDARHSLDVLDRVHVASRTGRSIALREIIEPRIESVPAQINRLRLQRVVQVSAYTRPGVLASKANAELVGKLAAIKMPRGYSWSVGGAAEVASRDTEGLGGVVAIAAFGILAVLTAGFGRFREVLVVAGVIPLGLVGGLAALLLTGNSLSFLAAVGFVALMGIEIKNSILLIDFATRMRTQGLGLREAIEKAGEIRFLPVLLTSVTAIGGLIPLALSGQALYAPLAWVIIGGLLSSTFLSRLVIPAMYLLVARH